MADALLPLAIKLLWDESVPLRKFVYSKLPFAKDAAKRKIAEDELSRLLEDSHKLAQSLSPPQAGQAIEKRLDVFRSDLIKGRIPPDQVDTIVDRGGMFVRMLVTDPILENSLLKTRISEIEKAHQELEALVWKQGSELAKLGDQVEKPPRDPQILAIWVGLGVLMFLQVVILVLMLDSGGRH